MKYILNSIYDELNRLKEKQNLNIYGNSINKNIYAKLEAEKDILTSLLFILQEKSMEYIQQVKR